MPQDNIITRH